jgi:hypothetical protein
MKTCVFVMCLAELLLRWEMFQEKLWKKIKTNFMFNKTFSEIVLWDNVEKSGRARHDIDENITGRMRFACWVTKATDTQSEYETIKVYAFTKATVVKRARLNVTLKVHCLSCPYSYTDRWTNFSYRY